MREPNEPPVLLIPSIRYPREDRARFVRVDRGQLIRRPNMSYPLSSFARGRRRMKMEDNDKLTVCIWGRLVHQASEDFRLEHHGIVGVTSRYCISQKHLHVLVLWGDEGSPVTKVWYLFRVCPWKSNNQLLRVICEFVWEISQSSWYISSSQLLWLHTQRFSVQKWLEAGVPMLRNHRLKSLATIRKTQS